MFSGLRAFSGAVRVLPSWRQSQHEPAPGVKYMCSAATGGLSLLQSGSSRMAAGLALTSGGMLVYQATSNSAAGENDNCQLVPLSRQIPWVQALSEGSEEMLNPGAMLRNHPVAKMFVEQDHLFETMRHSSQINEFRCFYEQDRKRFHSVVQLGKDVCGFPQTVHGGLTAAIIDETFGGLGICLWRSGAMGFRLPAYTARLEVDYTKKIPAGSLILCTTEVEKVEGRKVWMSSTVSDGRGGVYASARALFVAPRTPVENILSVLRRALPGGGGGNGGNGGGGGKSSS